MRIASFICGFGLLVASSLPSTASDDMNSLLVMRDIPVDPTTTASLRQSGAEAAVTKSIDPPCQQE